MVATRDVEDRTVECAREVLRGKQPETVAWVAYLSRPHLVQFAVELSEAVRRWAVLDDSEAIGELLDRWQATAELDAAPEVAEQILRPREEKEYVDWTP